MATVGSTEYAARMVSISAAKYAERKAVDLGEMEAARLPAKAAMRELLELLMALPVDPRAAAEKSQAVLRAVGLLADAAAHASE